MLVCATYDFPHIGLFLWYFIEHVEVEGSHLLICDVVSYALY